MEFSKVIGNVVERTMLSRVRKIGSPGARGRLLYRMRWSESIRSEQDSKVRKL